MTFIITVIFSQTYCNDGFRYPRHCGDSDCKYEVNWTVNLKLQQVQFDVTIRSYLSSAWAAVGFSNNGLMYQADIVVGAVYDGVPIIKDSNSMAGYTLQEDIVQDIFNESISSISEVTNVTTVWLSFKRQLFTGDDQDIPLNQCVRLLYPIYPGYRTSTKFSKHKFTPNISSEDICFAQCVLKPPVKINSTFNIFQFHNCSRSTVSRWVTIIFLSILSYQIINFEWRKTKIRYIYQLLYCAYIFSK